jgi:hypothetical protein
LYRKAPFLHLGSSFYPANNANRHVEIRRPRLEVKWQRTFTNTEAECLMRATRLRPLAAFVWNSERVR